MFVVLKIALVDIIMKRTAGRVFLLFLVAREHIIHLRLVDHVEVHLYLIELLFLPGLPTNFTSSNRFQLLRRDHVQRRRLSFFFMI